MADERKPLPRGHQEKPVIPGVKMASMRPEYRDAMDHALEQWQEHLKQRVEPEDPVYAFAYWLYRWSDLVVPAAVADAALSTERTTREKVAQERDALKFGPSLLESQALQRAVKQLADLETERDALRQRLRESERERGEAQDKAEYYHGLFKLAGGQSQTVEHRADGPVVVDCDPPCQRLRVSEGREVALRGALALYVDIHGPDGMHEDDCPQDDTCNCSLAAVVNAALSTPAPPLWDLLARLLGAMDAVEAVRLPDGYSAMTIGEKGAALAVYQEQLKAAEDALRALVAEVKGAMGK